MQDTAEKVVAAAQKAFKTGKTLDIGFRKRQLYALERFLRDQRQSLLDALHADLHKCEIEADSTEISYLSSEIAHHLEKIDSWTTPAAAGQKGIVFASDVCVLQPEPLGVSLIIGAWNFPVQLTLLPLIGAISAGCCAVVKPSEVSWKSAEALEKLGQYLDSECYHVVNGGVNVVTSLLEQRFDHIFYTGSSAVGKIIMKAASEHLTPVTLEMGGKSPCVVDTSCDLDVVAKRIFFGKFLNAGQVCISPDYVLCEKSVQSGLVDALRKAIDECYKGNPKESPDFGRIVNKRHFDRVKRLVDPSKVEIGGEMDESELYVAPTVMANVQKTDSAMTEEIFGPVLPIVTVQNRAEAIDIIRSREKPLILYVFSNNKSFVDDFQMKTSSGMFLANDTTTCSVVPSLPFGGVGGSGMGSYHGHASFKAFSHMKTVMRRSLGLEVVNKMFRYPPYTKKKAAWLKWALYKEPKEKGHGIPLFPLVLAVTALAILAKIFLLF